MTDQATTQPDPNTTQLATVEQQIASLSVHNIDEIGAQLGAIYDEAEARGDLATRDRAGWLWNAAQRQAVAISTAVNIAKTISTQRDAAINEHAELQQAVTNVNFQHPTVGGALRRIHQKAKQEGFDDGVEFAQEGANDLEDEFNTVLAERFDLSDRERIIFSGMMFGMWDSRLSQSVWDKFKQLISDVVAEAIADNPHITSLYYFDEE